LVERKRHKYVHPLVEDNSVFSFHKIWYKERGKKSVEYTYKKLFEVKPMGFIRALLSQINTEFL